ncbi:biotin transporter BioY [Enterobacteriaceae bacterium LUAb1]
MNIAGNETLVSQFINTEKTLKKLMIVFCASVVLAISAHFYIPAQPVPFTLQSFVVLLIGATLGRNMGTAAVLLYITEGLAGLPVFAGDAFGLTVLTAPSFGYIIGFVAASYVAGFMADKAKDRNYITSLIYLFIAHQLIFVFGVAWLSYLYGSVEKGVMFGYVPFMGFDLIKIIAAASAIPGLWKIAGHFKK